MGSENLEMASVTYKNVEGYEIGVLQFNSDYNFMRYETDEELNPCKVYYNDEDRAERLPFYELRSTPLRFKNGKMIIGSVYTDYNGGSIALPRYRSDEYTKYPVDYFTVAKIGRWEKYLECNSSSVALPFEDVGSVSRLLKDGEKNFIVRGKILKKMLNHLSNFTLEYSGTKYTYYVKDDAKETTQLSIENDREYNLIV